MRFSNWDVLLFPEDSRVPIQEFEVKCQALPQSFEKPISDRLLALAGTNHQNSVTHVPTLTSFVNSLDHGRPFRVSIHSWEKPRASDLLQSFKPAPETVAFEAKLYIDGELKARKHLGAQNTWPEVIDSVGNDDFTKPLRFPPFHAEILQQSHWDASDSLGRIRIIIAEGISHSGGFADGRGFEKLREVVVFSFQHAPRHILEYSGIAWPNARMFSTVVQNAQVNNFDAHAHSPRRQSATAVQKERKQGKSIATSSTGSVPLHASKWAPTVVKKGAAIDDPFIEPSQEPKQRLPRRTNMDVSMKDASAASSKNSSEMSGVEVEKPGVERFMGKAGVEEILGVLSPAQRDCLLQALLPLKQDAVYSTGDSKVPTQNQIQGPVTLVAASHSQLALTQDDRQCSNGSQRSASGQSGTMSWEETPTLGELWSGNSIEYPGLLPTLQSSTRRHRSDSVPSKRKRSLSPAAQPRSGSGITPDMRGMSTSPCKATSTPARRDQDDDSAITIRKGSKPQPAKVESAV